MEKGCQKVWDMQICTLMMERPLKIWP